MKKLALIEAINIRLPVKLHPKILAIYIGRAFNQIFYETFYKNLANMDIYTKTYKNVLVKFDTETETYYSKLPVPIIQLPNPGDGILSIHSMKGKGVEFVAKLAGMQNIQRSLEVSTLSGPIPYWIMDGRVEYGTKPFIDSVDRVRMRLLPQFEALDMMDEVHIPAGKDEKLLELVVQFAQASPTPKEVNDQTQKTP